MKKNFFLPSPLYSESGNRPAANDISQKVDFEMHIMKLKRRARYPVSHRAAQRGALALANFRPRLTSILDEAYERECLCMCVLRAHRLH